ncbi:MAG: DUF3372 domain-containing protein, partial [Acidimicrobiia bacterium]|nr:DUF3372 domain-containing protein [Acidimicrobiia bacterium]
MSKSSRIIGLVAIVALLAGACDSSGTDDTTTSTTTAATTTTQASTTTTTVAETGGETGEELPDGIARVHYRNPDGDYDDWVLHVWEDTTESVTWENGLNPTGFDDFGLYWDVRITDDAAKLGFVVHRGDEKDPGPDMFLDIAAQGRSAFFVSGDPTIHPTADAALGGGSTAGGAGEFGEGSPLADGFARVHYTRPDADYGEFRLHVWEDTTDSVTWENGLEITAGDSFGVYWDVGLQEDWEQVGFIVHRGDEKDPGPDLFLTAADHGREAWIVSGSDKIFTEVPDLNTLPEGDIGKAQAHWPVSEALAWAVPDGDAEYRLYHSPNGSLELTAEGLVGGDFIELTIDDSGLPVGTIEKFPHLVDLTALAVPDGTDIDTLLTGQLAVAAIADDGRVLDATSLQIPGVIDDRYGSTAPLGVTLSGSTPTLTVWAPTARNVRLHVFNTGSGTRADLIVPMDRSQQGVWSARGEASWVGKYYLYEVEVFAPTVGSVVRNMVTDPYSVSLATNSQKSQIIDLTDPSLAPLGWDDLEKPALDAPEDIVLYELHVRDFSAIDESVPAEYQGTFKAFTLPRSAGMDHLSSLANAGLTHVHLLPVFDIA